MKTVFIENPLRQRQRPRCGACWLLSTHYL